MIKNLLVFLLAFCLGIFLVRAAGIFNTGPIENISTISGHLEPSKNARKVSQVSPKFIYPSEAEKRAPRFYISGADSDEEVKDLFLGFQKAVAANDKKAAAALMEYPLSVYFPDDPPEKKVNHIKDRKSFIRVFDRLFDKRLKAYISKLDYENDDDFIVLWSGIGLKTGTIWIGNYCYDSKCTNGRSYVKIRTIMGNSQIMDLH